MRSQVKPATIDAASDALASLFVAAQEDQAFCQHLLTVLRIPGPLRDIVVTQAVDQMKNKGEDPTICAAFALLASDEIASAAIERLSA